MLRKVSFRCLVRIGERKAHLPVILLRIKLRPVRLYTVQRAQIPPGKRIVALRIAAKDRHALFSAGEQPVHHRAGRRPVVD